MTTSISTKVSLDQSQLKDKVEKGSTNVLMSSVILNDLEHHDEVEKLQRADPVVERQQPSYKTISDLTNQMSR